MTLNAVANRTEAAAPNLVSLSEAMGISKLSSEEIRARISERRRTRCSARQLTLTESAYLLCVSRTTARAYLGRLQATRRHLAPGSWAWKIPRESLEALAEELEARKLETARTAASRRATAELVAEREARLKA